MNSQGLVLSSGPKEGLGLLFEPPGPEIGPGIRILEKGRRVLGGRDRPLFPREATLCPATPTCSHL